MADSVPDDGPDVYVCPYTACARFFRKRSRLLVHLRSHTGERPYVCSFEDCLKSYSRAAHLKRHVEFSHGSTEESVKLSWQCPDEDCGMLCANKYSLAKHMKRKHGPDVKTFFCEVEDCGKECKSLKQLAKHERESHSINPFKCSNDDCGKVFNCESKLRVHQKIHEGYACSVEGCDMVLKTWSLLRKHVAIEHASETDLVCPICEKKFVNKSNQKMHMKVHMEERPMVQCDRPGCGRVYLDKRNLTAHIRSYHDGKRIPCIHEGCQRTFSCKNKMILHLPLHDPNRPLPKKKRKKKVSVPGSDEKVKKRRKRQRRKHVAKSMCGLDEPGVGMVSATDDDDDKVVLSGSESDGSKVHTGPQVHLLLTESARRIQVGQMSCKKATPSATITSENQGRQLCVDIPRESVKSTVTSENAPENLNTSNGQQDNEMKKKQSSTFTSGESVGAGTIPEKDEVGNTLDQLESSQSESINRKILETNAHASHVDGVIRGENSTVVNKDVQNAVNGGQNKLKRKYPEAPVLAAEAEALLDINNSFLIEPSFLKSSSKISHVSDELAENITRKTGHMLDPNHENNGHSPDPISQSVPTKQRKIELFETGDAECRTEKQVNPRHKGLILQPPAVDECGDFDELMFPRTSPGGACERPPADRSGPLVAWDIIALSKSQTRQKNSNGVSRDKEVKIDIKRCVIMDNMADVEKCGIAKTLCVPVEKEVLISEDRYHGKMDCITDTCGETKTLCDPRAKEMNSEVRCNERKDHGAPSGQDVRTSPGLHVD